MNKIKENCVEKELKCMAILNNLKICQNFVTKDFFCDEVKIIKHKASR